MEFLAPTSTCTCWAMQVHGYLVYVIHVVHNLLSRTTSTNLFSQTPDWIGHRCKQTMQYLYCSQWVTTDQKLTSNYDSAIRQHCLFSLFLETRLIFSSFFFLINVPAPKSKHNGWTELDCVGLLPHNGKCAGWIYQLLPIGLNPIVSTWEHVIKEIIELWWR